MGRRDKMEKKLKAEVVVITITLRCTLNCKLCTAAIPYHEKPIDENFEMISQEIKQLFQIYDHICHLDITGGEPLLHKDIVKIIKETEQYKDKVDFVRIISNATIVPEKALLQEMARLGSQYQFLLDDYGIHSRKLEEFKKLAEEYEIPCRVNPYCGDDQWCGGWVDLTDFSDQNYSESEWKQVYDRCHFSEQPCIITYGGYSYHCVHEMVGRILHYFQPPKEQYLDLLSQSIPLEKKKEIAASFGKQPIEACKYCIGFDPIRSKRYPAAEQTERRKTGGNDGGTKN